VSTPGLRIGLSESPSQVTVSRGDGVNDLLWSALDRNIAPLQVTFIDDNRLSLPLERLLASRNWLAQALIQHHCPVSFDDRLLDILRRQDAEVHEIDRLLGTRLVLGVHTNLEVLEGSRFVRSLKVFQRRDLAHLLALSHGANFSVPGAGKTTVAYANYEALRTRGVVERMLVVAPLSAFEAWTEEARACLDPAPRVTRLDIRPAPGTEVLLVNYQRLAARYNVIAEWVRRAPTHLVLDEAHRMKRGRNGEWGAACLDLAYLAARRDVLTGTPAPQHPSDFVALLEFLWPGQAARILPRSALAANPSPDVMADVSTRIAPLFVRTRKDELGLRPPRLRVELSDMKPLQQEIYEALRTRMRRAASVAGADAATLARMGAVTMYLLQAASNPGLLAAALGARAAVSPIWPPLAIPADSDLGEHIRRYAEHETPAKFDKLATMVASNVRAGRKTLVWSNFVKNLEGLASGILAPHRPAVIHGGVPPGSTDSAGRTREGELHRFRQDGSCTVLLANPAAMSEGVSLHEVCHDAIYVDRTFNAGQYLQSIDRIHRLGLPPDVETNITFLVHRFTIDETVDDRIRVKADRLSRMLEDANLVTMALPDEDDYGELIDVEDLDALFAHLRRD
jgi:SNF2 family DNA or RNA helicase